MGEWLLGISIVKCTEVRASTVECIHRVSRVLCIIFKARLQCTAQNVYIVLSDKRAVLWVEGSNSAVIS